MIHPSISALKLFLLLFSFVAMTGGVAAQSARIEVKIVNNALDLIYNGSTRMSGGVPKLENRDLLHQGRSNSATSFTFGGPDSTVTLNLKKATDATVIGLSLSTSGAGTVKGNEFQGFFFSSFPGFKEGVAFYRYKPWNSWTKPVKILSPGELESWDNQCFYWRYDDGTYGVAIPLSDEGYRTTLGSDKGSFGSKALAYVDDYKTEAVPSMVIGFGDNLYTVMKNVYESAMEWTGNTENLAAKKHFPEPLDYIGWCTWNASSLGSKLNEETVIKGVESFTKNSFPLGWVLLDDGWFTHKGSQLRSLQPDTTKFPNGFSPVIKRLKNEFYIKHVGVWHAFNGYWNGIDPNSPLGKRYAGELFRWNQKERVDLENSALTTYHFIKPGSDSLSSFYHSLHAYLRNEGVSFIKVDNQLSVERMSPGNYPIGLLAKAMHKTLNASAKKYFDNAMINCMDMTADAYYNFESTPVARSVEDYFPYEEGETYNLQRGNAAAHVLQGVYNNLYFSQLVFPDLDMFQSHNPNGEYHAIARAINNGPIYVTDDAGKQNFEVLKKLVLDNGHLLRADAPLLPTADCLFQVQDKRPFKAFSQSNGIGLVGVWNAADADVVTGSLSPSDVNTLKGEKFAVYEFFSGELKVSDYTTAIPLSMKRMGYQLYYIAPLKNGMAPLGLLDKYNAPATIDSYTIGKSSMTVAVKQSGTFGAALMKKPRKVTVNGKPEPNFTFAKGLLTVQLPVKNSKTNQKIVIEL